MTTAITQKWRCPACGTTSDSPFTTCADCGSGKGGVPMHHCELHGDLDGTECPGCRRQEQEASRLAERRAQEAAVSRKTVATEQRREASPPSLRKEPAGKTVPDGKPKKEEETGCLQCLGTLLVIGMIINFLGMTVKWLINFFR